MKDSLNSDSEKSADKDLEKSDKSADKDSEKSSENQMSFSR